jgi:ABC-type Na+ efflux pump permease subunit
LVPRAVPKPEFVLNPWALSHFTFLNFLLYATLYAGLGAMVKRQDEVQSAVQVPTMLLVSEWILVYLGAAFPNAIWC